MLSRTILLSPCMLAAACPSPQETSDTGVPCQEQTWYWDEDEDGFGDPERTTTACEQPLLYVDNGLDCDDERDSAYPDAPERCNDLDDDCDGEVDEDLLYSEWYPDEDGDGWGQSVAAVVDCVEIEGHATQDGDCDDEDPSSWPGAPEEPCTGKDLDCDGFYSQALVGEVEYATLDEAMAAYSTDDTVWVCPGRHVAAYDLPAAARLTLRGWSGSHEDTVLVGNSYDRILTLEGYARVTLQDLGFEGGDAPLLDGRLGGAILVVDSEVDIAGCRFHRNHADASGGAIHYASITGDLGVRALRITGSQFIENTARSGGALSSGATASSAFIETTDTEFSGNVASTYGGAIYVDAKAGTDLTLRSSSFDTNTSPGGGGIYFHPMDTSSFLVSDTSFAENEAVTSDGGAISMVSPVPQTYEIERCSFVDNIADGGGGALDFAAAGLSTLSIIDSTFQTNLARSSGGALIADSEGSVISVEGSVFTDNTSYDAGGAVATADNATLTVEGCTFEGNITTSWGAALASFPEEGGTTEITDSEFSSNTSGWKGGAVYAGEQVSVSSTTFADNESLWGGGLFYYGSGDLALEDVDIDNNQAHTQGGGLAVDADESPVVTISASSLTSNLSAGPGGGVQLSDTSTLVCDDVDWGAGTRDNSPDDLSGWGESYDELESGETFTCTPSGCDF